MRNDKIIGALIGLVGPVIPAGQRKQIRRSQVRYYRKTMMRQ